MILSLKMIVEDTGNDLDKKKSKKKKTVTEDFWSIKDYFEMLMKLLMKLFTF